MIVAEQFRGPPHSGNGGYVGGLMSTRIAGAATVVLRAVIPLKTPLRLQNKDGVYCLLSPDNTVIGEAHAALGETLRTPSKPPSYADASLAGARFPGLERMFHPVCFCCAPQLDEGYGLRVFVGQTNGAPDGHVSGAWSAHPNFADKDRLAPPEVVWAALDCPGSVAWLVKQGDVGLLGTMTCKILRRPAVGDRCIITAWPIEQSGRKRISGTALFTADGELLAHSHQVWITRPQA